jgi:hypothetical protein
MTLTAMLPIGLRRLHELTLPAAPQSQRQVLHCFVSGISEMVRVNRHSRELMHRRGTGSGMEIDGFASISSEWRDSVEVAAD